MFSWEIKTCDYDEYISNETDKQKTTHHDTMTFMMNINNWDEIKSKRFYMKV